MYKIQTLNAISDIIHTQLSADKYTVNKDEPVPDAILVRSAAMHDMEFFLPSPERAPASTIFLWTGAPKRASWSSTPPAPTRTPWRSW